MHSIHDQLLLSQLPPWFLLLFLLGLLSLTKFSISFLKSIHTYFLRPQKDLLCCYGEWTVVTGPTSGIGKSVAFELARNGMNLILVGRNGNKLEQVRKEICAEYGSVKIKTVSFDLSGDFATGIQSLREAIRELDVGMLVNNAGMSEPALKYFHEADISAWMKMVRVNLEAVAGITHAMLPLMLERKKKTKKSAIVNIGSLSASLPSFPLNSVYASTKAFVGQFSRGLSVEYQSKGIDVQCQIPFFVSTNMTSGYLRKQSTLMIPDSDTYARAAVRCIGYDRTVIPNVGHFLQWCWLSSLPDSHINHHALKISLKYRSKMMNKSKENA